MLTSKRPAIGLPPVMRDRLIGAVAARAIAADEPIQWAAVDFSGKTGDR
jgi:sialic acid synthase SpsE